MTTDNVSSAFMGVHAPIISLAKRIGLTSKKAETALSLVWDYHLDQQLSNHSPYNISSIKAYKQACKYIENRLEIFNKHKTDYHLTLLQEHQAALAWILDGHDIIETIEDIPDELLDSEAVRILYQINRPENSYPTFSDAETPTQSLVFDLKIRQLLNQATCRHKAFGVNSFAEANPEADRDHALNILIDQPPIETALTQECKVAAHQLHNILKSTNSKTHSIRIIQ